MKIYLVGGAVRDAFLGLPIAERDYVVVGAKPEDLLAQGFKPVGQFFPVFLHPESHEEYALARLERKTAVGHQGFQFDFSPLVTLEEDLIRRDLTVNAMASSSDEVLIDPYGGLRDLQQKRLRHVSEAFAEDPLRVFRVARFYARFFHLGFFIDPATLALMQVMQPELQSLSAERVWAELEKAILTKNPGEFFVALKMADCLLPWFPALAAGDFNVVMAAIRKMNDRLHDFDCRAAYLLFCIGKRENSPLRIPNRVVDCCACLEKFLDFMHVHAILDAELIMSVFEKMDAIRQPQRLSQVMSIIEAIPSLVNSTLTMDKSYWENLLQAVISVNAQSFVAQGLKGPEIGAAVRKVRVEKIADLL